MNLPRKTRLLMAPRARMFMWLSLGIRGIWPEELAVSISPLQRLLNMCLAVRLYIAIPWVVVLTLCILRCRRVATFRVPSLALPVRTVPPRSLRLLYRQRGRLLAL